MKSLLKISIAGIVKVVSVVVLLDNHVKLGVSLLKALVQLRVNAARVFNKYMLCICLLGNMIFLKGQHGSTHR